MPQTWFAYSETSGQNLLAAMFAARFAGTDRDLAATLAAKCAATKRGLAATFAAKHWEKESETVPSPGKTIAT